jgi:hypothetical protein
MLLDVHERLRRDGSPVSSILVGRTVGEGRAFWSAWMRGQGRTIVVSPTPEAAAGIAAYRARAGTSLRGALLFVTTPAEEALLAAIEAARGLPALSVATAVATDALAGLIASAQTPADLVRQAL